MSRFNYRGNTLLPYAALFVTLGQESGSSLLSGRYLLFTSPLGRSDSNIVPRVLLLRPLRTEEGYTVVLIPFVVDIIILQYLILILRFFYKNTQKRIKILLKTKLKPVKLLGKITILQY